MNDAMNKISQSERIMKKLCWALIALHVGWVCTHMYFHHKGALNPWKLGGYAMYTKPGPVYSIRTFKEQENSEEMIRSKRYFYSHFFVTGGCLSGVSKRFYKKIDIFQPQLLEVGKTVKIVFRERNLPMLEKDRREHSTYKNIGQATLNLQENGIMTVEEEFCDKKREFSIHVR
ncbi:MAG: hypothetical protein HRT94_07690 [Alphaproteobacteria bacterium]|nr:hypothetical protein [Alphaproteobacteria bacterium]